MNIDNIFVPALLVVFPLIAAICLNFLHGKDRAVKGFAIISIIVVLVLPWITNAAVYWFGGHPQVENVTGGTNIVLSKLNLAIVYKYAAVQKLFIAILAILASVAVLVHFTERVSGVYVAMIMLGIASTSAVIMADDIFNIFVFLEILTISQAALVIAIGSIQAYKTAVKYLIFGGIAGSSILLGIAILLNNYGLLNVSDLNRAITLDIEAGIPHALIVACALIFVGWLFESGMVPFHIIKSDIYSKARPSVAAFMQTQTKFVLVALWVIILRLFYGISTLNALVLGVAILSMVFGVIMALKQTEITRLLAYVAVAQAGLVGIGLGIGTRPAVIASIFHAVNDALAMAILFLSVSVVLHITKTVDMHKMGGLLWKTGRIPLLCMLGIFAVSGMPPFNTYQSEFRIITAASTAGYPELSVLIILTSIATLVALMKGFYTMYLKEGQDYLTDKELIPVPYSWGTEAFMAVLVGICLGIGLTPQNVLMYIQQFVTTLGVI
ncbi:MAG: proton-conducting transporter membrane subunit [Candidatus Methanofastidiosia archaeon]